MKITKMLFAVLFLAIIATIIAGCGDDSTTTPGALTITTTSPLAVGTVGTAYAPVTLIASGGTAPYTWSVPPGTLPAGLALSPAGVISGTPTAAATSNFTVTVTDSATPAGTATKPLSIVVGLTPPPPPVFDALAFYNASCINTGAGCHTTLGVRNAGQITNAIANIGAMNSRFSATGSTPLTAAQISAIAAVSH